MSKFLIHLLYVMMVMLPLGNHALAADEDDLMALEEDVMSDEPLLAANDDVSAEDDLMGDDDLLGSDGESVETEDISLGAGGAKSASGDETFPVAYEHIDDMQVYDPARYKERRGEFGYYKTGSQLKNGFRVNENSEESTDETIGILFFIVALPAQVYMNLYGWWQ